MDELTEKEKELIEAIRNYKKAFPNGEKQLMYYINEVLAELLDEPLN